jgi:hypothetical protein
MHTETTTHQTARRSFMLHSVRRNRSASTEHINQLRSSQLMNVASEEVEWFFTSTDTDGPALQARAIIEGWFSTLEGAHQRALALRFDPAPWPEAMQAEGLDSGYALAVSLVSTTPWCPESRTHHEPHRRAGEHLEAAVRERSVSVMRWVSRRADWDFASALRAYARVRGRVPSVVPVGDAAAQEVA